MGLRDFRLFDLDAHSFQVALLIYNMQCDIDIFNGFLKLYTYFWHILKWGKMGVLYISVVVY